MWVLRAAPRITIPLLPAPQGLKDRLLRGLRAADQASLQLMSLASSTTPQRRRARRQAEATASPGSMGGATSNPESNEPDVRQVSMEELVQEHADAVYRVALSICKDPILAEDISQDVLIKAWQALPSYRAEAPLRHWILRIAHNVSISTLRRRREDAMAPADLPEPPMTGRSVHMQVQDRLAIARFEAALGDLDSVSRSIVVLREIEGMSYSEMSNVLELPLPTIRTRLLRARRQLADALDGWQP